MSVVVRRAMPADALGIASVHVLAWVETYSHLVPADALARQSVTQRERRWTEIIAAGEIAVWVAVDEERIVGFASSGPTRGDSPPTDLELEAIYVVASHHGSGAGQSLIDSALGGRAASVWVAEDNPRARRFYERNGFEADGATAMHTLAGTPVPAIRMERADRARSRVGR